MCEITVKNTRDEHHIRAVGHATGSPEACAGISALLYSLGGWMTNMGSGSDRITLEDGDALLKSSAGSYEMTAAFSVAIIGLMQIEKAHPECVKVIAEG